MILEVKLAQQMANPSNGHYHSSAGLEKCQFFHAEIAMLLCGRYHILAKQQILQTTGTSPQRTAGK